MKTMQDFILEKIEEAATNVELMPVISKSCSNVGTIYIKNGFRNALSISFNFQSSYCSLIAKDENDVEIKNMTRNYIDYKKPKELEEYIMHLNIFFTCYDDGE